MQDHLSKQSTHSRLTVEEDWFKHFHDHLNNTTIICTNNLDLILLLCTFCLGKKIQRLQPILQDREYPLLPWASTHFSFPGIRSWKSPMNIYKPQHRKTKQGSSRPALECFYCFSNGGKKRRIPHLSTVMKAWRTSAGSVQICRRTWRCSISYYHLAVVFLLLLLERVLHFGSFQAAIPLKEHGTALYMIEATTATHCQCSELKTSRRQALAWPPAPGKFLTIPHCCFLSCKPIFSKRPWVLNRKLAPILKWSYF